MGHVKKIECRNCDYEDSFSLGSTMRSHPSGSKLMQCPECDNIEVYWQERHIIGLPEPKRVSNNVISKFLNWLEDKVLGPDDTPPRRKVVDSIPKKVCSKCGSDSVDFDFTSEDTETTHLYVYARCPVCHSKTLQTDSMPLGMFD